MRVINKIEKAYDRNLILIFEGDKEFCEYISEDGKKLIATMIEKEEFTGKKGETLSVNFLQNGKLISMDILGFGKKEECSENIFREVLFKYLSGKSGAILISSNREELNRADLICEIVGNINYSFDEFKEKNQIR